MTEKQNAYITTPAFPEPNYTQTPNNFFEMLPDMEHSEVNVTLVMIRNTFGFHKNTFRLGINKLADAAGLSRNAAKDGAEAAERRGTFRRANPEGQGEAVWELIVGQPVTPPGQPVTPPWSTSDQQVTLKEIIKKESKEGVPPVVFEKANKTIDFLLVGGLSPKAIQDAMAKYFRLTPVWEGNKFNRQWMRWAMENHVTPEQIKQASDLWRKDKRFNWSHPNLKGIQEHWLELVSPEITISIPAAKGLGFYG